MIRAGALLLLALAACAGSRPDLCSTVSEELRAVREKSRECDLPLSSLVADSCSDTSACTDADRALIAAEVSCVDHLPGCDDARSCRGDACADAMPGSSGDWQRQLDACRRKSAALTPGCRKALSRSP
jgi:hypothetical protein